MHLHTLGFVQKVEIGYYLLSPLTTYINFHPLISKVTSKLFQSNPYLVTITPRVRPKFMKMSFQSLHKVLLQTPPKYISNLSRYSKGITNSWKSHHKVIPGQPRPWDPLHSDLECPITFVNSKMVKFQIFNFFLL